MFLVTTADRRFWKNNEKILFLGEWCKLFAERENWSKLEHEVLPYHWDDRQRFAEDYRYLNAIYEEYLLSFAEGLNRVHGVNYSVRYWRILIGVWLRYFIDVLYDRYLSIKTAQLSGLVTDTWICSTAPCTPQVVPSFGHDANNLYLYSRIITKIGGIPFHEKELSHIRSEAPSNERPKTALGRILTEFIRQLQKGPEVFIRQGLAVLAVEFWPRLIGHLKSDVVFAGSIYLSLWDQIRLQSSLGQVPYLYHGEKMVFSPQAANVNMRGDLTFPVCADPFKQLLNELLPEQIPMIYVEHYREMHKRVMAISPKAPKVVITAFTVNYRRCFEFWASYHAEKSGTKLVVSQHGGGYGTSRHIVLDDHFTRAFDRYYTWGSDLDGNYKVKPMPSLRLWKTNKELDSSDPSGSVMWVATTVSRYLKFAESGLVGGGHMLVYFDEQRKFYEALTDEVRELLLWRYFADLWEDKDRFMDFAPNLKIQRSIKKQLGKESNFISELKKCRIAIHTANETTYLETLSANFPTLVFWNPVYFEVRESLQSEFDELLNAGILHYTPESAAEKLNEICFDITTWWESDVVQNARKRFCRALACTNEGWLAEWVNELKEIGK
ncbi:MAG: LIC12162 family protein [Desulfobulbaceae bacterium]|nr:LIC12162 family protein [Desulfobulbaceae bacterium]